MDLEQRVWAEIDKICAVNKSWVEMKNQGSCVSTFADENQFETEDAEDNMYVGVVLENLQ